MSVTFLGLKAQENEILIWDESAPNAIFNASYQEESQVDDGVVLRVKNVTQPALTVYKPSNPNGTAVVIFPGGGYRHLSINKEGKKVAEWLNTLGITAFVLKYRLPSDEIMKDKSVGPLQDAQKAIRILREKAEVFKINPNKIGVLGFSAGGHLAATLSTQYKTNVYSESSKTSAKPDFSILIYPVISMSDALTHQGSKENLLGELPSVETVEMFSNEKQVDVFTPKTFLVHATDDKSVPVENSIEYYLALKNNNVPVEMHIYETGGHGFGLGRPGTTMYWAKACENWLQSVGMLRN